MLEYEEQFQAATLPGRNLSGAIARNMLFVESNVSDLHASALPEQELSTALAASSLRREDIQHESELPADER
ncbi:hypothetical protein [Bradyrhizobium sp.]|uniref:hypothetical protein n=1 Tax=Bradyrhizobium sp. TaxID=376 RepID=UPI00391C3F86